MKEAIPQDVEKTLAYQLDRGFNVSRTEVKQDCFQYIESKLSEIGHHGFVDGVVQKVIDRWAHPETFMNGLIEKECNHPKLRRQLMGTINSVNHDKQRNLLIGHAAKPIVPDKEMDLLSKTSENEDKIRREKIRRRRAITDARRNHHRKGK